MRHLFLSYLLFVIVSPAFAEVRQWHQCELPNTQELNPCSRAAATHLARELLPDRGEKDRFSSSAWLACNGNCLIASDDAGSIFIPLDSPEEAVDLPGQFFIFHQDIKTFCQTLALPFTDNDGRVSLRSLGGDRLGEPLDFQDPFTHERLSRSGMGPSLSCDGQYYITTGLETPTVALIDFNTKEVLPPDDESVFFRFSHDGRYAVLHKRDSDDLRVMEIATGKHSDIEIETPLEEPVFSIDSDYLLMYSPVSSEDIDVYRLPEGELVGSFELPAMTMLDAYFDISETANGKILIQVLYLSRREYGAVLQFGSVTLR